MTLRVIFVLACFVVGSCNSKLRRENATAFRIIATDTGFEAPDAVPTGLRHIVFENHGSEIHEAMLVRLPDGMTPDDYSAAVRARSLFPKGALDYSGAGLTSPGESVEVWLKVDPGNYVIICWNDSHARSTPVRPLNVQYPISDDEPPKQNLVLKLIDYRFELDGSLCKGEQVIRVETPGPSMHEVGFFLLHEGKTLANFRYWRKEGSRGPAPIDALGGTLDSHDLRRIVWLRRNFRPGRCILHCELPVATDANTTNKGITHDDLGMIREVEIAK